MAYVRPSVLEDIPVLASTMREADRAEVKAAVGGNLTAVLTYCHLASVPSLTIMDNENQAVGIFGVTPADTNDDCGLVWMLASEGIHNIKYEFLYECRDWVQKLNQQYPLLHNFVDARNTLHIKWLKWCGFSFINMVPNYGVERRPFYEFVRVSNV